ncbi:MAG TPA: GTP cyclohydrolase II [Rhodocyclaceae bacterium]
MNGNPVVNERGAKADRHDWLPLQHWPHCQLPTPWGMFTLYGVAEGHGLAEHALLTLGDVSGDEPPVVRIHSECLSGDGLFSLRCDCGAQLAAAFAYIANLGRGMIVYLRQEGRGIGLVNKVRAYGLQDMGLDTVEANLALGFHADQRSYEFCAEILRNCGVESLRLLSNNPAKAAALRRLGIEVLEEIPLLVGDNAFNQRYLDTKARRMGHRLRREANLGATTTTREN